MKSLLSTLLLMVLSGCAHRTLPRLMNHRMSRDLPYCDEIDDPGPSQLAGILDALAIPSDQTGVLLLERGASALITRAWLVQQATKRVDAQYFLFAADNAGLVVTDALLLAAERGVKVRLLVDDTLAHGDPEVLQVLSAHPNAQVRIYNPVINVGQSTFDKIVNVLTDFRGANQRMHNKLFISDGRVAVTGGRNVGAEYFDLKEDSNFRDRDVLLIDGAVASAQASFEEYWAHPLATPLESLLDKPPRYAPEEVWPVMHQYACNPKNFLPMLRERIAAVPASFQQRMDEGAYDHVPHVDYVADAPGKNDSDTLVGGGLTTDELIGLIREAKESVVIQTPYLVTTEMGLTVFAEAERRGVDVRILTNSLAATDNVMAFTAYRKGSKALLAAGVELYEIKPNPAGQQEIMNGPLMQRYQSQMALHAKSMVVDGKIAVVGSFNLDPRSANLNTESIVVMYSEAVAQHLLARMENEMLPENAWRRTESFTPDHEAPLLRRISTIWASLAPTLLL